jgi:transposase
MAQRYELSEMRWRRFEGLLPGKAGDPGRTGTDRRMFVKGVLRVPRSGAHWHDPPTRQGKWKTVHRRFTRWVEAGAWQRVFAALTGDPDNEYVVLDTALVRPHQQAATGKEKPGSGSEASPRRSSPPTASARG